MRHGTKPTGIDSLLTAYGRGMKKSALRMDGWIKDVAPSTELRRWFNHEPAKWNEFRGRYFTELESKPGVWKPILDFHCRGTATLLYSAKGTELTMLSRSLNS